MLVGDAYQDEDLVFVRADGAVTNPNLFSKSFDRLVARYGLPRWFRLHDYADLLVMPTRSVAA